MNRVYRLVFNRALGVLQVVSELVSANAGAGHAVEGRPVATLRPVSFALWLAFGWVGVVAPGAAQGPAGELGRITADPNAPQNQRPTVVAAPNGTPTVNITTPSAAGVSRNSYSQFDVGTRGAILNNARADTQTQLGGWVQGNPWLATGAAKVILNEVNSAHPSYLNGYVEVAGNRAEVIIANPAGIQVDGGGFINASRATLTTGKPLFNGGSLDAYRVQGGVIGITGAGLDASQAAYTELIARALEINAGIWAQQLTVTAGVNDVAVADGAIHAATPSASAPAPAPGLAIDVGQLGGMYAGKITLVGTEHGVGVRNAGAIGAQAGDLVVTVDGRLKNAGSLQSQQDTQVTATGGVDNAGMLSAGRALTVTTPGQLDNSGGTLNAMRLAVDAQSLRNRGGAIEQTGVQALALNAGALSNRDGGRIGETGGDAGEAPGASTPDTSTPGTGTGSGAQDGAGNGGTPGSGGAGDTGAPSTPTVPLAEGALRFAGLLDNDGGRIRAGGGIGLSSETGLDNAGGQLGLRSLTLNQGDLRNQAGTLTVAGATRLQVGSFNNDGGVFQANGSLSLRAGSLSNREGSFQHGGTDATRIDVTGTLDNTDGSVASNAGGLDIGAAQLLNQGGAIRHAGTDGLAIATGQLQGDHGSIVTASALNLSAGDVSHRDATLSVRQVILDAARLDNRGGQIIAAGTDANELRIAGELDNTQGSVASNGDLTLAAARLVNVDGVVQQAGDGALRIDADVLAGRGGTLVSNGSLAIVGETTDLGQGIASARRISVDTGQLTTAGGQLTATGTDVMRLQVRGTLDNRAGTVGSNGALALEAGTLDNRQGRVIAAGTAPSQLQVHGAFDNRDGELSSAGDTALSAGTLNNSGGGLIVAGGDLALAAGSLDNRAGAIEHAGTGTLSLQAGTLQGDGGSLRSAGTLALRGGAIDLRNGSTQAERIDVAATRLTTAGGSLVSTGGEALRLQVQGALDNSGGAITSNGALDLDAGSLDNRQGKLTAAGTGDTSIVVAGGLDNADGTLASNAHALTLSAGQLSNTRGSIQQSGTGGLSLATGRLDGDQGTIATAGTLTLTAGEVSHRQGKLSADRIVLDAARLDNSDGQIVATGGGSSQFRVGGELNNSHGTLAGNGDLSLLADRLINVDGLVQQAGDGALVIEATTLDGRGGTVASNGALSLSGETIDLSEGVTSARRVSVDARDLSTAGAQLVATGSEVLGLRVRGTLDNTGGTIGGNGAIELRAAAFNNAQGSVQAAGAQRSVFDVSAGLDNRGGSLLTAGDAWVHAGTLSNQGGALQSAGSSQLQLTVDGLLDNRDDGVIASGGDLTLVAQRLDNRDGTVGAGGALSGTVAAGIDNANGRVQAGESLALSASGLANAGGTIVGGDVQVDTRGQALDNDGGTLASTRGDLDLRTGAVHNTGGLLQSAADLILDTAGQAVTNRDSGGSGGLLSVGRMDLRTGDFDNRAGAVFAQGDLQLNAAAIDNTLGGQLSSAANLALQAGGLTNTGGSVQAGGDAGLVLSAQLDNRGGLLAAVNALSVTAASVDNRDTLAASPGAALGLQGGTLRVQAGSLDNRQGQVLSDIRTDLQLTGRLDNAAGQVSSGGDMQVRADVVINTAGTLLSGGDQRVDARQLSGDGRVLSQGDATLVVHDDFSNTGELTANGTLSLSTDGELRNAGLLQGGNVELKAATIDNTADGEITAVGTAHVVAAGTLTNRGLIDGAVAHLQAGLVDNVGSGRLYGDHIAIDAGELRNRAETLAGTTRSATIAAREQLDLGVGTLANTGGGLIYSDGDAAIGGGLDAGLRASGIAARIDNLSSTIEIAGNLDIQAQAIDNIRENVVVNQVTTVKDPVRMDRPAWWRNGTNATSDIRSTSNYTAYEVYYLDPADILSDEPYVTPDGYTVHRAVVRLTPQTSAYLFGRGALYRASGERSRLEVEAGTVTLYYIGRQDNQANPDQVANGADDPFTELSETEPDSPAFHYVSDTLNYSSAYGTCTTQCVQLWTYRDYADPDHVLTDPHGTGGNSTSNNEQYRIATQTVTDDVLAPGMGADAIIHAGGAMRIGTDHLTNRYGSIAAGGNLDIVGLTAPASVTNLALTLYRTYDFDNVSHTFGGNDVVWSNPSISQVTGQVGGGITSGGTLTVDVGDLSNLNEGRDAPNVQRGGPIAGLDPQGPGSGPTGPGGTAITGPGAVAGRDADTATAAGPNAAQGGSGKGPGAVQGDGVAGRTVTSAADGSPDTIVTAKLDTRLPNASLFSVRPNGGRYLVETDPRFANYRNWLGSDYLLGLLGNDPALIQKRLGDGYYEQRLVNEQIGQLTGRRFLQGYGSDEEQYRALMDAGARFAERYGLRPGVALSAEQMAQLTSDIVWLVEQTVTLPDGTTTTALVPQVYLRLRPGDLNENGALLAGENVNLKLSGNLVNTGDIAGRQIVSINANNIRNLAGGTISGKAVGLQAVRDIDVIGATVTATDALSLKAGGNVTVASTTQQQAGAGFAQTGIDRVAGLYVTGPNAQGALTVLANGDITLQAARIGNAGSGLTALAAGGDLKLTTQTTGDMREWTGTGSNGYRSERTSEVGSTVQGGGNVLLKAGNDIHLAAAEVSAGNALVLDAGRDIQLDAAVDRAAKELGQHGRNQSRQVSVSDETVHGTSLRAQGDISLSADRDITLTAASIASEDGGVGLSAGRDISLLAAQEHHDLVVDHSKTEKKAFSAKRTTTHDEWHDGLVVGTTISGQTVAMDAGNDLTLQSAQLYAEDAMGLRAGRDVNITTAQQTHSESHDRQEKKTGTVLGVLGAATFAGDAMVIATAGNSKSASASHELSSSEAVGTSISAGRLAIASGRDTTLQGATVVTDGDLTMAAGRNLTLDSAQNTYSEENSHASKQSGQVGTWYNTSLGSLKNSNTQSATSTTQTGTQVASLSGDVTLVAGGTYHQRGSSVMALGQAGTDVGGDVNILAKDVLIEEAYNTSHTTSQGRSSRTVVGGSASYAGISLDTYSDLRGNVQAMGDTGDTRMKALAAANLAIQGKQLYDTASALASGSAGFKVSVNLSNSQSQYSDSTDSSEAVGSSISGARNVNIVATGGGEDSNIHVIGSSITAGDTVNLAADNDILLEASQDTYSQRSTNSSSGASVGVGFAMGTQNGFTIELAASRAQGSGNADATVYNNTHVSGGKGVNIVSGGDLSLRGAVVDGQEVNAHVGGNLLIESLQDISVAESQQSSSGASLSLCAPPFCYGMSSGSLSIANARAQGNYAGVYEQSGIKAGDGGFNVQVAGDTTLVGGVISSTQQAIDTGQNSFHTGGALTLKDIENHSESSAESYALSGEYSFAAGDQGSASTEKDEAAADFAKNHEGTSGGAGIGSSNSSQSSITKSGISGIAGDQSVRTGDDSSAGSLKQAWDVDALMKDVQAQAQITAEFGQRASSIIGDYAQTKMEEAAALREAAESTDDPAQRTQLLASADQLESQWGAQGTLRLLAHTAVGGLTGGLQGAAGAATGTLTAPAVANALREAGVSGPLADALTGLASTAVGGALGGQTGAAAAFNEVVNNYLRHDQRQKKDQEKAACGQDDECARRVDAFWSDVSQTQSLAMKDKYYGYLTAEEQDALANLKPGTEMYDKILADGLLKAATSTNPILSMSGYDWSLLTQSDWLGAQNQALTGGLSLADRNRLEMGVLGPVWSAASTISALFGATEEQIAAANQAGAIAFELAGTAHVFGTKKGTLEQGAIDAFTVEKFGFTTATVGGKPIAFDGEFYSAEGMKFSKSYYERLWLQGGRPAPFLQAKAILGSNPRISPDPRGAPGYFKYEGLGMEMIYNPSTGQVGHIQPGGKK